MARHDTRSVLPSRPGGDMPDDVADPKGNPIGTELVYEDDSVRVWRIELAPGETAGWHTHYLDYTTVVVEGDLVERPNADGSVDRIEVKPGAIMRWNQGTLRHARKTIGTKTSRIVIVEVRARRTGAGAGPGPSRTGPERSDDEPASDDPPRRPAPAGRDGGGSGARHRDAGRGGPDGR